MAQKITIKILDRKFPLAAESPEQEREIREAAEKVDGKYRDYLHRFPGKSAEEILSIVALNGFVRIAELEKEMEMRGKEDEDLHARLRSYLDDIEQKNSR